MKVLFVASEAYPLIKTGGLADVVGALPEALQSQGVETRLLLPNYPGLEAQLSRVKEYCQLGPGLGGESMRVLAGHLKGRPKQKIWLLDCPELFERDGGPYLTPEGHDHPDNHKRFAALSWAGAVLAQFGHLHGWQADLVHCHDWQTGLVPVYLKQLSAQPVPVMFTIHNLQYTGFFEGSSYADLALSSDWYRFDGLEYYGRYSLLKAGIVYSQAVSTVSPTYASEILTEAFGCGLEGLLQSQGSKLSGILNGVDYQLWNPASDKELAANYSADTLADKVTNKLALQRELGLPERADVPVFGVVSRLTEQKGLDLVLEVLPQLLAQDMQFVLVGTGSKELEQAFCRLAEHYPQQVSTTINYDEALSHRLQAGVDALLVPSRFEPCGLTQLYALQYGTLPVVRKTGGLADSVREQGDQPTGFVFTNADTKDLSAAMQRAIDAYKDAGYWQWLQSNAMSEDFSWLKAAEHYLPVYQSLVGNTKQQ